MNKKVYIIICILCLININLYSQQAPSLETMEKQYNRDDFYNSYDGGNLNNAYDPSKLFDREHDTNIESLKERSKEKLSTDSIDKKIKWKDVDSYYDKEKGESNTNTDVYNIRKDKEFKYNYNLQDKIDLMNAMAKGSYEGSFGGKQETIVNPDTITKMVKTFDDLGYIYSKKQCSSTEYIGDLTNFASSLASSIKSGIDQLGMQGMLDLLNSVSEDDLSGKLEGQLNSTELDMLMQSIEMLGNADAIPTVELFTFLADMTSVETAKQTINQIGAQVTDEMVAAVDVSGVNANILEQITKGGGTGSITQAQLQQFLDILSQAEKENKEKGDSSGDLFSNINFADMLGSHKCITAAKRFVNDLSNNYMNIWTGWWCPCKNCRRCFTPISQVDIWKQGNLFSALLSNLNKCADSTKQKFQTNAYVKCVSEKKNSFTEMGVESLVEQLKKRMDKEKEAREFTRVDSELNKKSLNYLLYGTDEDQNKKKYDTEDIYSNDITALKERDKLKYDKNDSKTIYLPSGQKVVVTNKAMEYSKTDDFVDQDNRNKLYDGVIKEFENNKLPYLVHSGLVFSDINKERYQNKINKALDLITEYETKYIERAFHNDQNNVFPIKNIVDNCNSLMTNIYSEVGRIRNFYISETNSRPTSAAGNKNEQRSIFNLVIMDKNLLDDFSYNISLLSVLNDMTYYACTSYYNKYKKYLSESLSNITGLVDVNSGERNSDGFTGNVWNEELQRIYERNFEKMKAQIGLLNSYENSIRILYDNNIEMINTPLQQFTY